MKAFFIVATILFFALPAYALDDKTCILAVLGEENIYQAQVAIASTIRHRGNLEGVFGHKSKRIKQGRYNKSEYDQAKKAWLESKNIEGFDGWGSLEDVKKWKTQKWFKNCVIVKKIGNTYFWNKRG